MIVPLDLFGRALSRVMHPRSVAAVATLAPEQTYICVDKFECVHTFHVTAMDMARGMDAVYTKVVNFRVEVAASEAAFEAELTFQADKVKRRTMNFWG